MRICFKGRTIAALIAASAAALLLAPAAFSTGLEGYWTLNEGRGTTAADSSGNGNTANVIGGARWVGGKFKNALQFDGVDDAMQVPSTLPNFSTLEPQTVTVEAWVKRSDSPGVNKHIVAKGADACNAASYALYTGATGGLAFYIYEGIQFSVSPNPGPGVWDGNWHHVAGTYDGFTVRLYVDGVEVGGGTPSFLAIGYGFTTTNDLYGGMYAGCSGNNNFNGAVDEPRIWSRALGSMEIAASAAMGFDAANEIKRESVSSESIVFTSHFKSSATGGPIVISLESASGLRTISNVRLETNKGTFGCGGTPCPIVLSNGGRTASLAVTGTSRASGKLRVTLDNASTFAANVVLG